MDELEAGPSSKRARPDDPKQEARQAKRQKVDSDNIFKVFLTDWTKREMLRRTYNALKEGQSMMSICILSVTETNARLSEGFSRASCVTSRHIQGNKVKTFELGSIFINGLKVLKAFTDKNRPRIPANETWRKALGKLLKFMYDDEDQTALFDLNGPDSRYEGVYVLGLAQHLLSPLAIGEKFTIDRVHQGLQQHKESCPCKTGERLNGKFGDTSFGCKRGWHGASDILMEDALPVDCSGTSVDDVDENLSLSSSTEVKSADMFPDRDIKQLTAKSIVFSFLQHKYNKEEMENFLVPCIGISGKKIMAYFYDSVHDVLLSTAPVALQAEQNELNPYAVVFLWLTLNYKIFCTGITKEMEKFKGDFFKRVDDCLDMYRNEVIRPCPNQGSKNKNEEEFGWAVYPLPSVEGGVDVEIEDSEFLDPI